MERRVVVQRTGGGVSAFTVVGMGLAAYASWVTNQSVFWACIHAVLGWLYVFYRCAGCGGGLEGL